MEPAAAFACERLREAELAWTRAASYCLFLHAIPLRLSAKTLCPIPTGVRRLSTRFNGVRGVSGGLRGEIRNLPWPPDKGFPSFCERIFCTRSNAVSSVQNPATILNRFSWQALHPQPPCIDRTGEASPSSCTKPCNHSEPLLMAGAASPTSLHSPDRRSTALPLCKIPQPF